MARTSRGAKQPKASDSNRLRIDAVPGQDEQRGLTNVSVDPAAHAMAAVRLFNQGSFGEQNITELFKVLSATSVEAKDGDLGRYRAMLASQADTLNSVFTEMLRRAAVNMGEHLNATQTYMRLGLKTQAQCRATIEALDSLSNGRVQTVKHVHVNEGGQAIVADNFHQHSGGTKNDNPSEQPHATGAAGTSPALPCPDPIGPAVPIPGSEGKVPVPNARRQRQRRT